VHGLSIPALPRPIWLRQGTSDFDVMEQIFVHREYDIAAWPSHHAMIRKTYADLVAAGRTPVIVDCGANIGFASIWFALQFPQARVYAVEPEPDNFAMLQRNAAGYANIVPVQAGVSDRVTRMTLRNPAGEAWAFQTAESAHGTIESVTLPDLVARAPDAAILIVKIDIEGSEGALFRSNGVWAAQTPLMIFEMHDWLLPWQGTAGAVLRHLVEQPRDYLIRGENLFAFAHPVKSPAGLDPVGTP
jgi:FkbM family methyltransferase